MTNEKICPACGNDNIIEDKITHLINEAFGGSKSVELVKDTCELCGTSGDFSSKNDELLEEEINKLKVAAAINILQNFAENGISMSSMERALELPQRTLTKWKSGTKPSAAGLALLKFLRTFPWLLEVAEHKFDYSVAQRIHINTAIKNLLDHMQFNDSLTGDFKHMTTANTHNVNINFNVNFGEVFTGAHECRHAISTEFIELRP
ncbi:MAG: hypothetical protein GQ559_00135 [Desulfobulbaceae bacterium]|nr:hypothetical protein [Desulfobulbaceae bacterium]